ncbi:MAG: Na+/H+ antiporter NhaA [Microthrixaceae bacterium]
MSTRQDFQTPKVEILGGVLLLSATVAALVLANSPWSTGFIDFWHTEVRLGWSSTAVELTIEGWINDALMAIFFFGVGIEIKQELVLGQLAHLKDALLPVGAAVGGVILPALIYLGFTAGTPGVHGWGIPMATDIAFVMGLVALAGRMVPSALKVTLLALAVVDDIIAIVVIALFYGDGVDVAWLIAALIGLSVVSLMKVTGVRAIGWYVLVGSVIWYFTFRSGVHATIAGVTLGLLTPVVSDRSGAKSNPDDGSIVYEEFEVVDETSVAQRLENRLTPVSAYLIVPLFALANAGISLGSGALSDAVSSPISRGIFFGLVAGKVTGVTLATAILVRLGMAKLPPGITMSHIVSMGLAAGIGFTVSLFITGLAFENPMMVLEAKAGILAASLVSGLLGLAGFWFMDRRRRQELSALTVAAS